MFDEPNPDEEPKEIGPVEPNEPNLIPDVAVVVVLGKIKVGVVVKLGF